MVTLQKLSLISNHKKFPEKDVLMISEKKYLESEKMQEEDLAREELKRIDHLIFVTLKYTRTVDIIRTIIGKLILTLDHQTAKYYSILLEKEKIKEIPPVPLMRMKNLEHIYPKDNKIKDIIDFYVQLKAIFNADFKAKEEYRKNVTLVTKGKEINIPMLKEYADTTKDYTLYIDALIK